MDTRKVKFTYEDYLQVPEDRRVELIEGDFFLVPSPGERHQRVVRNLGFSLWQYVRDNNLGVVYHAPLDVILSDEDVVQPDILFVSKEREGIVRSEGVRGAPDIVVEVLSPSTAERDRGLKRKLYAKYGVRECWLVNSEAKTVEVLALKGREYELAGVFPAEKELTSTVLPGISFSLEAIFQ